MFRLAVITRQVSLKPLSICTIYPLPHAQVPAYANTPSPDPPHSFFYLFLAWSKSFHGYRRADVQAVHSWWAHLEGWCREHAPRILATLNPPASERDISTANASLLQQQVTDQSGNITTLPYLLRLLYRFHNGQKTLYHPDVMVRRSVVVVIYFYVVIFLLCFIATGLNLCPLVLSLADGCGRDAN
jgi:hypothetical protein